ncbi:MAG: hypothetical protein V4691_09820 [Pseudomonadota bacterium]
MPEVTYTSKDFVAPTTVVPDAKNAKWKEAVGFYFDKDKKDGTSIAESESGIAAWEANTKKMFSAWKTDEKLEDYEIQYNLQLARNEALKNNNDELANYYLAALNNYNSEKK